MMFHLGPILRYAIYNIWTQPLFDVQISMLRIKPGMGFSAYGPVSKTSDDNYYYYFYYYKCTFHLILSLS